LSFFATTRLLSRCQLSKVNGPVPTGWAPASSPAAAAAVGEKGHPGEPVSTDGNAALGALRAYVTVRSSTTSREATSASVLATFDPGALR
jgi:hypothetical protein